MRTRKILLAAVVGLLALWPVAARVGAQAQEKPTVKIPEPGVPQIMTLEGMFVRAAYNNEAYVILGYKTANYSIGEDWMLLEIGTTMREGMPAYALKRDAVSLETPDGKKIPLPSVDEYRSANLTALNNRANVARDSINYFPPMATQACRIGFFSELGGPVLPWDQVELSYTRACLGRLYFKVPGGIKYGQHWLDIQFPKGLVRAPFRILTKDEEKLLSKNYKDIRKQVQAAFAPPKKKKN
jgi:hypothetical protein